MQNNQMKASAVNLKDTILECIAASTPVNLTGRFPCPLIFSTATIDLDGIESLAYNASYLRPTVGCSFFLPQRECRRR